MERRDASAGLSAGQRGRRLRTLRLALFLSAWAPLATGVAVAMSQSTTQLADFVRRTVELLAIGTSYAAFARGGPDRAEMLRARWERWAHRTVVATLATSGLLVATLAASRGGAFRPGGDVTVGLAVAAAGLLTNAWFWRRYARFEHDVPSAVIGGQRALYRAKTVVDASVLAALGAVALAPGWPATRWIDLGGSWLVAAYLGWSAARTARRAP